MKKIRILIVDDHSYIRKGVRSVIESQSGWEICGEADNGRCAVELASQLKPDVAVLDITMPRLNGLEATRILQRRAPGTKVLILTMHDSDSLTEEVMQAGARGYILKSDAAELLPRAIEAVAEGKTFVSPKIPVNSNQPRGSTKLELNPTPQFRLTPREREIVKLLAEGKSNKEVAAKLGISLATVETHRKNILSKLKLHNTADLVRYAIRNGLVQP